MNKISKVFVIVLILLLSTSFSQNSPTSQSTKSINTFYDDFNIRSYKKNTYSAEQARVDVNIHKGNKIL